MCCCEAYGFAVVANSAFATAKPDALKGFVCALIAGIAATVKEPARAADEAASRIDGSDSDFELERLRTVLERSIDQIAQDFKFRERRTAGEIFDDRLLPPVESRLIN